MHLEALGNAGFRRSSPIVEVGPRRVIDGVNQANHDANFFSLLAADAAQQQLAEILKGPVVTLVKASDRVDRATEPALRWELCGPSVSVKVARDRRLKAWVTWPLIRVTSNCQDVQRFT
jgi:hypothetical protein